MQPTLTLHCPKLVQNIKIRISCDVRVYTRKILRSSVFSFPHLKFEPSGSAVAPNPTSFKNGVLGQNTCIEKILKSYKNSKNLLDVFIQKLPSKIYKMCSTSGVKRRQKKVVKSHNGPFPKREFSPFMRRECKKYTRGEKHRFFIFY